MKLIKKISVLGTVYTISKVKDGEDAYITENNLGGYCDSIQHVIVLLDYNTLKSWDSETDLKKRTVEKQNLRHEVIHAFLNESGLKWNSLRSPGAWAQNEEMVDWFALQFPKICEVFRQLDCM